MKGHFALEALYPPHNDGFVVLGSVEACLPLHKLKDYDYKPSRKRFAISFIHILSPPNPWHIEVL
ncbi:hypothetical protein TIFTF001_037122 [Ficus carica]|uniref:Uncharacterized protein n=1 Tax=Ficus carica TaxID=3494 RepID=A0AA88E858_FICCA|nr:hypothetical protein TIFTF001_037122 [Ficus carica]